MNNQIFQHFRSNEREIIQYFATIIADVQLNYAPYLTNFLNPRERYILKTLVNSEEIKVEFYGGFAEAEMQRALIYPEYFIPQLADFEIVVYEIKYATKFNQISHPQILGTLLNNGIKREFIGDIVNKQDRFQIAVATSIAKFLPFEITKISRVSVELVEVKQEDYLPVKQNLTTQNLTISSLRLDNIIANVYNIPRNNAKNLIQSEKCKVNFTSINTPDYQVEQGDLISVRSQGRFYLQEILGLTKKGRYKVVVNKLN